MTHLALIGLGRIGAFHAATLAGLDEVERLVITDAVPEAADRVSQQLAEQVEAGWIVIDVAPDAAAALASGVDGVVIASSTPTHLPLLRAAVEAGLPAFCEKPVAEDPYAAAELLAEVERAGAVVQIGFPRRFDPDFLAAKAARESGELGWITTVRSTTMDPAPPPAGYIAASGGIFRDCAIHDLDAVRWVTGREVVEVYATGGNQGSGHGGGFIAEAGDVDTGSALLTFDDQTLGVVSVSRYNGAGYDVRLELHGSQGSVAAGYDDGLPIRSADASIGFPAGPAHTFFMDRLARAFRDELTAFTEVVAGRQDSPCTMADGLEASWIAEACARSLAEHRPVRLAEVKPPAPAPAR